MERPTNPQVIMATANSACKNRSSRSVKKVRAISYMGPIRGSLTARRAKTDWPHALLHRPMQGEGDTLPGTDKSTAKLQWPMNAEEPSTAMAFSRMSRGTAGPVPKL